MLLWRGAVKGFVSVERILGGFVSVQRILEGFVSVERTRSQSVSRRVVFLYLSIDSRNTVLKLRF